VLDKISTIEKKVILSEEDAIFSKIQLNYEDIEKDPSILYQELHSITLFNSPKFILINNTKTSFNKEIKESLLSAKTSHVVIFKADELGPSTSTRKLFETEQEFAALPCYQLDEIAIKSILVESLRKNNIKFSPDLVNHAATLLRGEHASILSEIQKLLLYYANTNSTATEEEITEIISGPSEKNSYDPLILSIINRDFINTTKEVEKLYSSGVHIVAIARNIATYFVRLLKVKTLTEQGVQAEDAINSLKPPIFFKNITSFKKALQSYSTNQIIIIIEQLTSLELECKTTDIKPILLWEKYLYEAFISKLKQEI